MAPIVIRLGRLGNTIMLHSLIGSLTKRFGDRCKLVGTAPWSTEVYRGHDDVQQVCSVGRHEPLVSLGWWRVRRMLRRHADSPIYVCEVEIRQLRRIRRCLASARINPTRCRFLSDFICEHPELAQQHWVERLVAFANPSLGTLTNEAQSRGILSTGHGPLLQVLASERVECQMWLEARGWNDRPLILVQPGNHRAMCYRGRRISSNDSKAWDVQRWAMLLRRVHDISPGCVILLCGAVPERALLKRVRIATRLRDVKVATPSLRQLFALCEIAISMIAVDSGPAHAAAALGLPLLVLFGASPQSHWLPRSNSESPVVGIGGPPFSTRLAQISVNTAFEGWRSLQGLIHALPSIGVPSIAYGTT